MPEWIEANVFVKAGSQQIVLLTLIKPLIQTLRSQFNIESHHFLHEPNNEIRFRVLTTSSNVVKIKKLIDNLQNNEQVTLVGYTPFEGEKKAFGEDGWKTTYKFLEAGSEFALDLIDQNIRKGNKFNRISFSHYFLNQSGFGQLNEADFHASAMIERIVTWAITEHNKLNDKITQLENRIKKLESDEKEKQPTKSKPEKESQN